MQRRHERDGAAGTRRHRLGAPRLRPRVACGLERRTVERRRVALARLLRLHIELDAERTHRKQVTDHSVLRLVRILLPAAESVIPPSATAGTASAPPA